MNALIEKNAARIIITTLLALVIVGIAIGAGLPFITGNYDPGHSILEIGDPNYYFVEDTFNGTTKFLTLELPTSTGFAGRLEIRPGEDEGLVIRQGGSFGLGEPGLVLRSFADHARLNFYDGVDRPNSAGGNSVGDIQNTPNQLSIYTDKVVVPDGISLTVDKKIYQFTCASEGNCECVNAGLGGTCNDPGLAWEHITTFNNSAWYDFQCPNGYAILNGGAWCEANTALRESRPIFNDETRWRVSCLAPEIDGVLITCTRITDNT